jgi:hypothetical protein
MREQLLKEWEELKAEMDANGVEYDFGFDPKEVPLGFLQQIISLNRVMNRANTGNLQGKTEKKQRKSSV